MKTCYNCGEKNAQTSAKLTPTIKLSSKKKTIKQLHSFNLNVKNIANGDAIKSVKVSNSKVIATKRKKNKIVVTGKKVGNATITVKLKSGKTAKCKVTVKKDKFTYKVKDVDYSTRTNTYTIKLKNTSKHSVTIYAENAKLIDWDYVSFDRYAVSVNGKSSVSIKPGKTTKVKFKLGESTTWPGYDRKTMKFKIKFDGKYKWIKISENDL